MNKLYLLVAVFVTTIFASSAQSGVVKSDTLTLVELEEVLVIGTRAKESTPMTYSNLMKSELKKNNYGKDIPFLLSLTPSVVATSDAGTGIGYTGFRIRGTDANRINVTTNGVPLNDSESQGVFWVNMPDFASSIQDLQIQRGVGTSTNGAGAFGASVNMKTDNISSTPFTEVTSGYGSFNTFRRNINVGTGLLGDHSSFVARFSKIDSDGYINNSGVQLMSYFLQYGYYSDNSVLKLITFGGKERTNIAWNGLSEDEEKKFGRKYNSAGVMSVDEDGKPVYYDDQTDNYNQRHYQAIYTYRLSDISNLNATAHYTRGLGFTNEYRTKRRLREYNLEPMFNAKGKEIRPALIRQKHLDNHFGGLILSLSSKYNDKYNDVIGVSGNIYTGEHFGKLNYVEGYTLPFKPNYEYYRGTGKKKELNSFYKAYFNLTQDLTLYGDVQYRYIKYTIDGTNDKYDKKIKGMQKLDVDKTFNFFNPKVGLFYNIASNNSIFASVSKAQREPNRKNYTEGAEELAKAESMLDYEFGYNYKSKYLNASVNLYYMDYKDQLVLNGRMSDVGHALTVNVDKSYRAGIEFSADYKPVDFLMLGGNLTLSKNKIKDYKFYAKVYDKDWNDLGEKEFHFNNTTIALSPDVLANGTVALIHKGFMAQWICSYVGKQYLDNTGSDLASLKAYCVNNLSLTYSRPIFNDKNISLGVMVNNIFNAEYSSNGSVYSSSDESGKLNYSKSVYPQAGINFMTNLTLSF